MFINEYVRTNNLDMVKYMLNAGDIIINDADYIEDTTLGVAIKHNCSLELINFLLNAGAEIKTEYRKSFP